MKHSTKKQNDKQFDNYELEDLLSRLQVASKRVNAAAQDAGRRIQALEDRLADAEPGVAVWGPTLVSEPITFLREDGQTPETAGRVVTLGYTKVKKDKWGIAVREVVRAASGAILSETTNLLSKADRSSRLLALPHLESLTRQVVEAVEAQAAAFTSQEDEPTRDPEPLQSSGESASPVHN